MTGWVKWLGECVSRLLRLLPWREDVKLTDEDKDFWYRTYGVCVLAVSLAMGVKVILVSPGPFSKVVAMVTTYSGADKPLAQAFTVAFAVLAVGLPLLVMAVVALAFLITALMLMGIVLTKGVGGLFGLWAGWYIRRHGANSSTAVGALIGALAGAVIAVVLSKNAGSSPPAPTDTPPVT